MLKTREMYRNGEIDKYQYADAMFSFHKKLLEYPELLGKDSYIHSVELCRDGVVLNVTDDLSAPEICRFAITSRYDSRCFTVSLLNHGRIEESELSMVRRIMDAIDPQVVFDVGANEGWYSVHLMKRFPRMVCYSFEPLPETYERVKRNFRLNGLDPQNVMNIGLSDHNGDEIFYYDRKETGASSMRNIREKDGVEKVICHLRKMDDFVKENDIENVDFIKADVEGAEFFVLKGGGGTLRRDKPVVLCEMLRKWAAKFGYHPNDIIKMMEEIGYDCFAIEGDRLVRVETVTEETAQTNFFFLCRGKHERILSQVGKGKERK